MKQKSLGKIFLMEQNLSDFLMEQKYVSLGFERRVLSAPLGLERTGGAGSHQEWIIPEPTPQGHRFQSQPRHTLRLQRQESAVVIETQNELSGNTVFKPT